MRGSNYHVMAVLSPEKKNCPEQNRIKRIKILSTIGAFEIRAPNKNIVLDWSFHA